MLARVGVILSGCGYLDGAEITEAVSILIALDRRGAEIVCMAPDIAQAGVVDHLTGKLEGKAEGGGRRVLAESARIARGKVLDLANVKEVDLDALVLPGGFGAAKNLSTFAVDGANCKVDPQVERILKEMYRAKKPIGLACIAPVIAARIFGRQGAIPKVTIGTDKATADAIESMGGQHVNTEPAGVCVDEANLLVTTPCYMNDVGAWVVYQGAEKMVEEVLRLAQAR